MVARKKTGVGAKGMWSRVDTARARRERGEGGFTLVELLVVVIIITVISAIAVPIYLGQRGKANDAKMEGDLSAIASLLSAATSTKSPVTFTEGGSTLATASSTDAGLRSVTVDGTLTVTGFASGDVPSAGDCVEITRTDGAEGTYCLPGESAGGESGAPSSPPSSSAPPATPFTITYSATDFAFGSDRESLPAPNAAGNSGSVTYAVTSGTLPTGVTLESATGVFTGPAGTEWNFVATQITAGEAHTCALVQGGTIKCWGSNQYGQVNGTANSPATVLSPQTVPNISNATQISAGQFHTCARLSNGTVKCWGRNNVGQLGGASTSIAKADLSGVTKVAAGHDFTCALLATGSVTCWGVSNEGGTVLQNRLGGNGFPETIGAFTGATDLDAGAYHACAVLANKRVMCWGDENNDGRLGNSGRQGGWETVGTGQTPANVLADVTQLALGFRHSCARLSSGAVRCWGYNDLGQMGTGSEVASSQWHLPVLNADGTNLTGVASIAAGDNHTCAVLTDGTSRCWGAGGSGRLGTGNTNTLFRVPAAAIARISGVQSMEAGGSHTCSLTAGGKVWCWGASGSGRLGNGSELNESGGSGGQLLPLAVPRPSPQGFPVTLTVTATDGSGATTTAQPTLGVSGN